jgi:hypothetical protein
VNTDWTAEIDILQRKGVSLGSGLTNVEILAIEDFLGFHLPPDLISFLRNVLPLGERFPNWRRLDTQELRDQLAWPFHGIAFDIEHNAFWWPTWGARPAELRDAIAIAQEKLAMEPPLVPVFGHRYLPAEPQMGGNPVISVYQTDIIYYGSDLRRYIAHEFGRIAHAHAIAGPRRRIRFWSDVIDAWL